MTEREGWLEFRLTGKHKLIYGFQYFGIHSLSRGKSYVREDNKLPALVQLFVNC